MRARLGLKMLVVAGLVVLLAVPLALVQGVVRERASWRAMAVENIAASSAGEQALVGPVLVLPWRESVIPVAAPDVPGAPKPPAPESRGELLVFPQVLAIDGEVATRTRALGLHEVRVYELAAGVDAQFAFEAPPAAPGRVYGTPYLRLGIRDVRGLIGVPALRVDGRAVALRQGAAPAGTGGEPGTGLHAPLPALDAAGGGAFALALQLELGGTQALSIAPVGDDTRVALRGDWPHPRFGGAFAPRERSVGADGFSASWALSSLAADAQAQVRRGANANGAGATPEMLTLGFVDPVDVYLQADRATKYGLLFVLLTFLGFFLFEVLKRLPVHPVQYGLVGLALALFFLLLVSLSEHLPFWQAYVAAALACLGLIGHYVSGVLRSRWRGLGFAGGLGLLYAALYGLLVSEDNALVLGALLLFAVLAAVMVATRRLDWYRLGEAGDAAG